MEEDVQPVLPLVAVQLQEADGRFSLSVLFAFPSPTASGFDIGVTAALSVTSTSTIHISFFFPLCLSFQLSCQQTALPVWHPKYPELAIISP